MVCQNLQTETVHQNLNVENMANQKATDLNLMHEEFTCNKYKQTTSVIYKIELIAEWANFSKVLWFYQNWVSILVLNSSIKNNVRTFKWIQREYLVKETLSGMLIVQMFN